jgi:hypothetical protein
MSDWTAQTNRPLKQTVKVKLEDPLDRAQSATLAGLNAALVTAEQEFSRAGPSDPVLTYGPPRVCDQGRPIQPQSAAPAVEWPWQGFATGRVERSLVEMPRQLTLPLPPVRGAGGLVEAPLRLTLEPESVSLPDLPKKLVDLCFDAPEWARGATIPEPPELTKGHSFWRVLLHAGGALGFAAFAVWVVVSMGDETMQSRFSDAPIPPDAVPAAVPALSERLDSQVAVSDRPTQEHQREPVGSAAVPSASAPTVSTPTRAAITRQPPPAVMRETPPSAPQPHPTIQPMAQDLTARQIDPDELASLVRRGDDFVNFRDLSSARLLYQRAAEAGNVSPARSIRTCSRSSASRRT